jgi:hypothetical protein
MIETRSKRKQKYNKENQAIHSKEIFLRTMTSKTQMR